MWVKVSLKVMILAGGLTSMSSSFITSFMIDAQNNEISFKLVSSVYLCTLDWNLCPTPPGMVRTWPVISLKLFWGRWVWDLPLCFDSHFLVNTSRCSSQYLSVISSKHCLYLQWKLRPTGTLVRPKNSSFLGLKILVLPHHSLKIARWDIDINHFQMTKWAGTKLTLLLLWSLKIPAFTYYSSSLNLVFFYNQCTRSSSVPRRDSIMVFFTKGATPGAWYREWDVPCSDVWCVGIKIYWVFLFTPKLCAFMWLGTSFLVWWVESEKSDLAWK